MRNGEHYEVLDGLRGVAALLVLIVHISQAATLGQGTNLLPNGALGVDFFFCLSGFVVAHAYDRRWEHGMTLHSFVVRRLIRLHPLVVLATVVGTLAYLFGPFQGPDHHISAAQMAMTAALALLLLPYPGLPDRYGDTHSLDGPTWTLLQEYIGNLAYALVLRHLSNRALLALAALSSLATLACGWHYGTLSIGFDWTTFWGAFVRLAYPFLIGLWLSRSVARLPTRRAGFWTLAALVVAAFAFPLRELGGSAEANGMLHAAFVIVLFPAIILLGAHSRMNPQTLAACRTLGRLSYPLYILHYPFVYLFVDYIRFGKPGPGVLIAVTWLLPLGLIGTGWAALRLWDEPLRAWLTARFLSQKPAQAPLPASDPHPIA